MKKKALPILLLDERVLKPSFGYVFDRQWLDPYESIVSILWKVIRMNRLSESMVAAHVGRDETIDPYEGIAARRADVDVRRLQEMLGVPLRVSRNSLVPEALERFESPYFRFCRRCLWHGYHGVVHQLQMIKTCPIHQTPLEVVCLECGERMPYRLSAHLLGAAYRCGHCRHPLASTLPGAVTKRPLGKRARVAMSRARMGLCSYF